MEMMIGHVSIGKEYWSEIGPKRVTTEIEIPHACSMKAFLLFPKWESSLSSFFFFFSFRINNKSVSDDPSKGKKKLLDSWKTLGYINKD